MIVRKKYNSDVENLDVCEEWDEGFIDGEINIGKTITAFNFTESPQKPEPALAKPEAPLTPAANIFITSTRGLTPTIDGESYTIKRGYQFRPSTIRKLHELKARHPDVNAYLNTIIDNAINHYYNYILSGRAENNDL